ncbi:Endoribonuclease L-PSP [Paramicrosporidium saccamoebae]|uniref:Endoribonuclease L-PSP n=1 Tax=Paramicrosporidium saccamoebae TaxID=1246581 RepID=A0A2H9TIW8_9FUNG|nr:Endoribonuclease L-PSP [Paramicrosporidium saccamoebae]
MRAILLSKRLVRQIHMRVEAEKTLRELGYDLDKWMVPAPKAVYVPVVKCGKMLYTAGHVPYQPGTSTLFEGKVGAQFSVEEANKVAELIAVNMLKNIKDCIGTSLWVLNGFVNADGAFAQHSMVINGASELLVKVFGSEIGSHARTAVGAPGLPFNGTLQNWYSSNSAGGN